MSAMRLKTITAESMPAAIRKVRDELGEDAIIVSSQQRAHGGGVRVTVAIDQELHPQENLLLEDHAAKPDFFIDDPLQTIKIALDFHRFPASLSEAILMPITRQKQGNPIELLAQSLSQVFKTTTLFSDQPQILMPVGVPGSGKTVSIAKIAAHAKAHHIPIQVISTDTLRAGGIDQLSILLNILELPVNIVSSPDQLKKIIKAKNKKCRLVIIDSPGINPFIVKDLNFLRDFVIASGATPLPVIPGGCDPEEAQDLASIFANLGAKMILPTKFDCAKRLGGVFAASYASHLAITEIGVSPHIMHGLHKPDYQFLAKVLLQEHVFSGSMTT